MTQQGKATEERKKLVPKVPEQLSSDEKGENFNDREEASERSNDKGKKLIAASAQKVVGGVEQPNPYLKATGVKTSSKKITGAAAHNEKGKKKKNGSR